MKVAFVHLGRENLGIEYLSTILKNEGHKVKLFLDLGLFGINDNVFYVPFLEKKFSKENKLVREVMEFEPDITAFSVATSTYQWSCRLANKIKQNINTIIIFGGIHSTLLPKQCIKNSFVDFLIKGDAELAFPELINKLEKKQDFTKIKNLCYKKNDNIVVNPLRKPINLDSLPLPDKSLFEDYVNFRDDYLLVTSRGCIYNCSFCCEGYLNKEYNHRFFRRRGVDHVMKELKFMKKKYNFKRMMIQDDIFFTNKRWLEELLTRLEKEIKVPFRCQAHVTHFNEKIGKMLKNAGCYCLEFGIQTMNQEIRKNVLDRMEDNRQIEKVFKICDRIKLNYEIDHIFDLPFEKEEDYINAAKFYSKFKYVNRIKCHYMTYFPKTKIIDRAIEAGLLNKNMIKDINNGFSSTFFHGGSVKGEKRMKELKDFENLFKILPLFSERMISFILNKRRYKFMHLIPSPMIIFLQIVLAIKKRDYRYTIYINRYLDNIKKLLLQKERL